MTKKPRKPSRSSSTVLVVDPDAALRKTARGLLDSLGYRVLDAEDAAAAEQIARLYVGPIHVLLVEADVSGLNGQALAGRLQLVRPELRVLYASDRSLEELIKQGQLVPGALLIQKPLEKDRLARQVRAVLNDSSGLSSSGKQ